MSSGTLYIIATPIGNLEDITLRALRILREEVSFVYCEDTRTSGRLLSHYDIQLPLSALHGHSHDDKYLQVVEKLKSGHNAAYLSDAGTPGVSDPGGKLVSLARGAGVPVVPLPGPSALTALLSVLGFPAPHVLFAGFLSRKPGKRRRELQELLIDDTVAVIYESPHRMEKLGADIAELCPGHSILIGRELTKLHEETVLCQGSEVPETLKNMNIKGEFVLAIISSK